MGMESRSSISLLLTIFLLSSTPTNGKRFNIFAYLGDYPEYSQFLDLLNRTLLAQDISGRDQITVLVVRNENIGDVIPRQKLDVLQPLLCAHVLLEFIDKSALQYGNLKFPHTVFTVYQTTGAAEAQQGQIMIYRTTKAFLMGSAIKGVRPNVKIVKQVRTDQTSHSVLEVSGIIVTPGISDDILPPPAPPLLAPPPKRSSNKPVAPSPEDDYDDTPADSPADSPADTPAESPADDDSAAADEEIVPEEDEIKPKKDDSRPPPSSAWQSASSAWFAALSSLLWCLL